MYIPNLISTFKFNIFPKLMVMMMRGIPGYRKVPCLAVMLESTGQPVISVRNEEKKFPSTGIQPSSPFPGRDNDMW